MADPLGADALAALVNELNITKHEPKLQAANITTLRQLKVSQTSPGFTARQVSSPRRSARAKNIAGKLRIES